MDISIYVCYNKKTDKIPDPVFKYIYCGAAVNRTQNFMPGTLRDDTGTNISGLYPYFAESTAMYWAWKNDHASSYIGFMASDLHLNFSKKQDYKENESGIVEYGYISDSYLEKMCLNAKDINLCLDGYDIIMPKPFMGEANKPESKNIGHIKQAQKMLEEKFPNLKNIAPSKNSCDIFYPCNCFIMKREIFDQYCSFLFKILMELNDKTDFRECSTVQLRHPRMASLALLNIFMSNPAYFNKDKYKIKELQPTRILYPSTVRKVAYEDVVPIVMSFDDKYCKYAAASMQSIIANSSAKIKYKIYVLHRNISEANQKKLNKLFITDNIKLEFINISYYFYDIKVFDKYFPQETYYRLVIPELFGNFTKVIYIDSDTISRKDIYDLYNIDIENFAIAAANDPLSKLHRKRKILLNDIQYPTTYDNYCKNSFSFSDDYYINAGLILFNIVKCNKLNLVKKSFLFVGRKFMFCDQDIINMLCKGHKKIIDSRWNVFHYNPNFKKYMPIGQYSDYLISIDDAYLIHFGGPNKPWLYPSVSFAEEFWKYARNTPYYEELLLRIPLKDELIEEKVIRIMDYSLEERVLKIIKDFIFPPDSPRKKVVKSIYILCKKAKEKLDSSKRK